MARKPRLYRRKSRRRKRGRLKHGATPLRGAMNVQNAYPLMPLGDKRG
jgi:hypothetical protein